MNTRIYIADTAALEDPVLYEGFYAAMPLWRKEKIDALRLQRDKRLSLGAGVALQKALRDIGIQQMPAIACGANGKPYFPKRPELRFNLSHSNTKVMCALSDWGVGCDVERIASANLRVAKRFFSAREYDLLAAQSDEEEQKVLFCRIWTLKESFLKATGKGLSLPMNCFSVCPNGESIHFEQSFDSDFYDFFEMDVADGFRYACCLKHASFDEPPEIFRLDFQTGNTSPL